MSNEDTKQLTEVLTLMKGRLSDWQSQIEEVIRKINEPDDSTQNNTPTDIAA